MSSGSSSGMKWPASIAMPSTRRDARARQSAQRIEALADQAARAPEQEQVAADLLVRGARRAIVLEIDRGAGAVVLAGGVDRVGAAEAALVLGERLGLDVAEAVRAPAAERPAQVERRVAADHPLGQGRRLDQEEPVVVADRGAHVDALRTCRASARCRSAPAARPDRHDRAPVGARPGRRGRGRRRRSAGGRGRSSAPPCRRPSPACCAGRGRPRAWPRVRAWSSRRSRAGRG